ncbi:MAG: 2-oxoglutarate and iron-dependent oxygenase domain-containing protein [Cyanobacteria bacterium P01_A01_bin.105]
MTVEIPLIDFSPFIGGDRAAQQAVAEDILQACETVGFFYLRGHGVSADRVKRLLVQSRQFFALPLEAKRLLARSPQTNCGYVGYQQERLNPAQPWDVKEAFNVGLQSVWPPDAPDFQAVVSGFYEHCTQTVAPKVLQAFAIALSLPPHYFDDKHGDNYFLRLLHYPPIDQPLAVGQLRAGAHTDYGTMTLLWQDAVGGLEVQTRSGLWVAAPPIPDTVVVNVGDALQRWTNDRLRSTLHRVTPGQGAQQHRYAVALFCDPNPEVVLSCLPGCAADYPPRYAPIRTQDHLNNKLNATY